MTLPSSLTTLVLILFFILVVFLLPGCSLNGRPMRFNPQAADGNVPKAKSWFIEGQAAAGIPISCSFVEFDERGDFLDFRQHKDCEARITHLAQSGRVLVVIYCHGWKNNSQSGDVTAFNAFLCKLAASQEIQRRGLRVHGVYLGWRGNVFNPYVDRTSQNETYTKTTCAFGEPIVDATRHRWSFWSGAIPENLSYWNRKAAAEYKVSGLPMARAIFTYASAAKGYGKTMDNRVCVIGHSFGALLLERSLGHAMTGGLTMEWWGSDEKAKVVEKAGLPFDLVLFVNSAAPAIYAKEMRDFLMAHRSALGIGKNPAQDVPVIISLTSTADLATGSLHPIGNFLAPFMPSLQRRYTTGIFGKKLADGSYPTHPGIRQSEFYTRTPGHQPYLINHWIVKGDSSLLPEDPSTSAVFSSNLASETKHPDVFFTSKSKYPAAAWQITSQPQGKPIMLEGLSLSMTNADYWIITCGKELIAGHNDVWTDTTMEMYAGIFRAVESRRGLKP